MFLSRWLRPESTAAKWLGIWLVLCCLKASHGLSLQSTFLKTVTKARCTANCFTLYGGRNNVSENICQTTACQECLLPCGKTFRNETLCLGSCSHSNSCEASCRFLTHLKNFSSILTGDGSGPPTPGIPTVTNKAFATISLQWEPVTNTSGTPVYMVAMEYKGDSALLSPFFFIDVFTVPRATLETSSLCALVEKGGQGAVFARQRFSFNGIFYKFHVAILTDNSSISYGAKTTENITLRMPKPVSNITVTSIVYDSSQFFSPRLKVTASWNRPADAHGISNYAIVWTEHCYKHKLLQTKITAGPEASNGFIYINEDIKKCNHTLTVYALNKCIPSNGTTLTYEYPGCANITNYPTVTCYEFDPPDSPAEHRQVRNVTYRLESINDDYTFNMKVTWDPPLYSYLAAFFYVVTWQRLHPDGFYEDPIGDKVVGTTSFTVPLLLPKEVYGISIYPFFGRGFLMGIEKNVSVSTPEVDPAQVTVRNLTLDAFTFSPQTKTFEVYVSWEKPPFNYSEISAYIASYQVNEGNMTTTRTSKTFFNISGILHGQPIVFSVTPDYVHNWIKGGKAQATTTAPVPINEDITVRDLQADVFDEDEENNTFTVTFTWKPPDFKLREILHYNISYELSGYPRDQIPCSSLLEKSKCKVTRIVEPSFQISGIFPQEHISITVTPVYHDKYIKGKGERVEDSAPAPRGELLTVVGMQHDKLLPSSNNSFQTTVKWQKPLFKYSAVSYYRYKTTRKTKGPFHRRAIDFNSEFNTNSTSVTIDGIQLDEAIEFQVTPVFDMHNVMGIEAKLSILKKRPPEAAPQKSTAALTTGEVVGLVIGLLLLILIITCLVIWWHRERETKRQQRGLVSGPNGLMIDHWEVEGSLVTLEEELDEGAFGKVYKGALKQPTAPSWKYLMKDSKRATRTIDGSETFTVAVKLLQNMSDGEQRRDFLAEIQLMKTVGTHKNIVNMLGCCTVEEPLFLLLEYVPYGSLLHYLRKHRGKVKEYLGDDSRGPYRSTYCETFFTNANSTGISVKATKNDHIYVNAPGMPKEEDGDIELVSYNSTIPVNQLQAGEENQGLETEEKDENEENEEVLTPGDLMAFAWQITQGMEYLAKKGFVHRDLAARNVLVGEKKIAKVADFGLTRHVYEEKVYHAKQNRKLPLKWMSIEAIFDQTFTTQSDVWAFGVLLWELVTLGGTPYPTIDNKELLKLLKEGYRMEKPETCNEELYKMMTDCWQETPETRPNFTLLRESLETMMQKDNPYLDLTAVDESRDYYNAPSFNSVVEEATDDSDDGDNDDSDKDDQQKDGSNKYVELEIQGNTGDSDGKIAAKDSSTLETSVDIDNNLNDLNNSDYRAKGAQDPKDVKINFLDLERSFCRPTRRGFAF